MFKYFVLFALVAVAFADDSDKHAEIKVLESEVRADGFNYALETNNGISAHQSGDVKGVISGHFEWVDPKGEHIKVSYVADENGYQPQSDVLPTPPPIPAAILKSLEYLKAHADHSDDYKH